MNTYCVNIVTDTKTDDLYDAVAVNKFPVVYVGESVDSLLAEEDFRKLVCDSLKSDHLFEKSKLYIREISIDDELREYTFNTRDKIMRSDD